MTNTEWLCLRLGVKIAERAKEAAKFDLLKLQSAGGYLITEAERERFFRNRIEAHEKALLSNISGIMQDVVERALAAIAEQERAERKEAAKLAKEPGA